MANTKLTKTIADHAKYEGTGSSMHIIWDKEVTSFGLRVYPTGKKSFVIFYRNSLNQQRFMTLGKYGVLTVQQAREIAQERLVEVNKGTDPLIEKRRLSIGETLKEFSETYLERYAKIEKRSWREDERMIKQYLIPALGGYKLKQLDRGIVSKFHHVLGKKSIIVANRTLSILSRMYTLAYQWGAIDSTVANPVRGIDKFKESSRERWLTETELLRLNTSLMSEKNIYARAAIVLFLQTGLRKSELLKSKWEHIKTHKNRAELLLPETKSGKPQYIHLSKSAIDLLSKIPKQKDNPYIFPGKDSQSHLVNLDKPWRRIRKAAELEDVHIHDLRRTLGSRMVQAGHSLKVVKETLRHKDIKTTEIYARIADSQKSDALEEQGDYLQEALLGSIESFDDKA